MKRITMKKIIDKLLEKIIDKLVENRNAMTALYYIGATVFFLLRVVVYVLAAWLLIRILFG